MKSISTQFLALVITGFLAVSTAFAADNMSNQMQDKTQNYSQEQQQGSNTNSIDHGFMQLDADQSGKLSKEEYEAAQTNKKFSTVDQNQDGELSKQEVFDSFAMR